MKNNKEIDSHRRKALKALGGGVVAGAVLSTATTTAQANPIDVNNEQSKDEQGYKETQHIRDYYDSL
ncbi:hypothetical protein AB4343_10485 [Vibrio breoganii]|uniref:Transcriptional initiation protein Tat n=2 Tax=Vibrio TaxID=662 RepID=A0AAJ3SCP1_9VIBR|nr:MULTISPECIES: hypothetical protein [Vibrio]MDN3714746.1 hypothetical protein [Vibrio breoganii]NMO73782.1 hypothetical protein [Vibrio breoganii]NMR70220.1 hypothetical protein [Vibrio breoganii]OCH72993.1 hypothetical protein A6D95_16990 [Vibrio breoganii]OED90068.1 hypothetical protein A1QE_17295 [Vibrio breoganii ZF-55]